MAAGLRQSTYRVHCRNAQSNEEVTCTDQRKSLLLLDRSMRDGSQYLWIETGIPRQLLGIDLIALPVTMRDRPQLTDVGHNDFMAQLLKLFADSDRVCSRRHPYSRWRPISEPLPMAFGVVRKRPRSTTSPSWLSMQ